MDSATRLISTPGLVRRVTQTEIASITSRMRALERIPANPAGIAFLGIDEAAVALMARNLSSPWFNSVLGIRAEHESLIQALAAWYRAHDMKGRFVVEPANHVIGLGREFMRCGYYPSGFHATLIREPDPSAPGWSGTVIEAVTTAAAMEEFLDAYAAGRSVAEEHRETFKRSVRPWFGEPGWAFYLARIDAQPAAAATLYLHDRGAHCADAATDPSHRSCGLQAALLRRRIFEAGNAGADFVFGGADYLSASHRNMERAGMQLLSVRTIWTPL